MTDPDPASALPPSITLIYGPTASGKSALALSIAGAHYKRSLPPTTIAIGEVGLGGELRAATQLEQRLRESARLGYTHAIVPASGISKLPKIEGMELIPVKNVSQAIERLM